MSDSLVFPRKVGICFEFISHFDTKKYSLKSKLTFYYSPNETVLKPCCTNPPRFSIVHFDPQKNSLKPKLTFYYSPNDSIEAMLY